MSNKPSILDQLHAAAVEIDGAQWVRARTAIHILGLTAGWYTALPRRWQVSELRRIGKPDRDASRGVQVFWMLESLLRFAHARATLRTRRAWTADEDRRIVKLVQTRSIRQVAKVLGRPFRATQKRVIRLGGLRAIRLSHGFITSGTLMGLTRKRAYGTIASWRRMGLAATRSPGGKDMLFKLADVRAFFMDHPTLLITMDPAARKLLRLTTADLEAELPGREA